jgi:hypothetical protein
MATSAGIQLICIFTEEENDVLMRVIITPHVRPCIAFTLQHETADMSHYCNVALLRVLRYLKCNSEYESLTVSLTVSMLMTMHMYRVNRIRDNEKNERRRLQDMRLLNNATAPSA